MNQFFPAATDLRLAMMTEAERQEYNERCNDMLWSDRHKDVFGFRPREAWHKPDPDRMEEACEALSARAAVQFKMDDRRTLANQYRLERNIAGTMQRLGFDYPMALLHVAKAHDVRVHEATYENGTPKMDEGQLCYEYDLPYGLEPMFRHILKGELA